MGASPASRITARPSTAPSLMSDAGTPVELIADLIGHKDLAPTWKVYRHRYSMFALRPDLRLQQQEPGGTRA